MLYINNGLSVFNLITRLRAPEKFWNSEHLQTCSHRSVFDADALGSAGGAAGIWQHRNAFGSDLEKLLNMCDTPGLIDLFVIMKYKHDFH